MYDPWSERMRTHILSRVEDRGLHFARRCLERRSYCGAKYLKKYCVLCHRPTSQRRCSIKHTRNNWTKKEPGYHNRYPGSCVCACVRRSYMSSTTCIFSSRATNRFTVAHMEKLDDVCLVHVVTECMVLLLPTPCITLDPIARDNLASLRLPLA